jgi:hypothetical protein
VLGTVVDILQLAFVLRKSGLAACILVHQPLED